MDLGFLIYDVHFCFLCDWFFMPYFGLVLYALFRIGPFISDCFKESHRLLTAGGILKVGSRIEMSVLEE
jgi:hypothetical protein